MRNFSFFNLFLFLFFAIKLILSKNHSLILQFNVYQQKDYNDLTKEEIFESIENNYLYTIFNMGNPPNKIPLFYTFDNSSLSLKSNINFISLPEKNYFPLNSKTFMKLENNKIQEEIIITNDNEKTIKNFTFLYQNDTNEKNLYGYIGLQNFYNKDKENNFETNFLYQLKILGLIDNITYNLNYTSENEGYININIEPNDYSPTIYSNKHKYTTIVKDIASKEGKYLWNIDINSIYYKTQENEKIIIKGKNSELYEENVSILVLLNPQYGLIKGSSSYKNKIEKEFFNNLIEKKVCSISEINKKIFYSCKSNDKKEIKEKFHTVFFEHKEFNYIFELNYEDLFYEKNDILYFLICFDAGLLDDDKSSNSFEWILGKPFMKKYLFSFDVEKNEISFYEDINTPKLEKIKNSNNLYVEQLLPTKHLILISLVLFIILTSNFCIINCKRISKKIDLTKNNKEKGEDDKSFIGLKESNVVIN